MASHIQLKFGTPNFHSKISFCSGVFSYSCMKTAFLKNTQGLTNIECSTGCKKGDSSTDYSSHHLTLISQTPIYVADSNILTFSTKSNLIEQLKILIEQSQVNVHPTGQTN